MKKNILICEDDEGIIDVTTIILTDKGYNVASTMNGREIFEKIEETKPDLILLDLWMPDMNGEEVAKKLKAHEHTRAIPIIIVSASKDIKRIAMDAGVDDFLPKPFDLGELETIVAKYIN